MAYKIVESCIGCGACEPECANRAISEGETQYVIDPYECTECLGNFPYPRCRQVCPIQSPAPMPDPNHWETRQELRAKWRRIHSPVARSVEGPGTMKAITEQKPFEKIKESLDGIDKVFIAGCGTCAAEFHTGGRPEVLGMKKKLEEIGKIVTGAVVIPTACDNMTNVALEVLAESRESLRQAQCILVMACGLGVQTVATWADKLVLPALNTLFIGREERPSYFSELCVQCEECMLVWTGGVCPISLCAKNLVNGPCGGTKNGKCEVDPDKDCAWTLIYQSLERQGRLDLMLRYSPFRDFRKGIKLGKVEFGGS